jgi:hypothetical protein
MTIYYTATDFGYDYKQLHIYCILLTKSVIIEILYSVFLNVLYLLLTFATSTVHR